MAIQQRRPAAGLIVHSDRGSQGGFNRSSQHPESRRCLWDNAVAERFFLNLNMERVWQRQCANHAEASFARSVLLLKFFQINKLAIVITPENAL